MRVAYVNRLHPGEFQLHNLGLDYVWLRPPHYLRIRYNELGDGTSRRRRIQRIGAIRLPHVDMGIGAPGASQVVEVDTNLLKDAIIRDIEPLVEEIVAVRIRSLPVVGAGAVIRDRITVPLWSLARILRVGETSGE